MKMERWSGQMKVDVSVIGSDILMSGNNILTGCTILNPDYIIHLPNSVQPPAESNL